MSEKKFVGMFSECIRVDVPCLGTAMLGDVGETNGRDICMFALRWQKRYINYCCINYRFVVGRSKFVDEN